MFKDVFSLSQIFKGECIYNNFNDNVYTKGFFFSEKKNICTEILIYVQNFKS